MNPEAFKKWATGPGRISAASARSYVSYLTSVEAMLRVDLDQDWARSGLKSTLDQLERDESLNPKTKTNRLSGLRKYVEFRATMSA